MFWFLCKLADEKEESLPSMSKTFQPVEKGLVELTKERMSFAVQKTP